MQFAPESIDLILSGVKTQTRRPVKDGDTVECHPAREATVRHDIQSLHMVANGSRLHEQCLHSLLRMHVNPMRCSEPDPRDIQYARVKFLRDLDRFWLELDGDEGVSVYRNGVHRWKWRIGNTYAVCPGRGKRQVARIRLTGIRCEAVGSISNEDAMAEGVAYAFRPQDAPARTEVNGHIYPNMIIKTDLPAGDRFAFTLKGETFTSDTPSGAFIQAWGFLYKHATPDDLVWALTFAKETP